MRSLASRVRRLPVPVMSALVLGSAARFRDDPVARLLDPQSAVHQLLSHGNPSDGGAGGGTEGPVLTRPWLQASGGGSRWTATRGRWSTDPWRRCGPSWSPCCWDTCPWGTCRPVSNTGTSSQDSTSSVRSATSRTSSGGRVLHLSLHVRRHGERHVRDGPRGRGRPVGSQRGGHEGL